MHMRQPPYVHRAEVFVGRSAAIFVHPLAAWYSPSRNDRTLLLIAYFTVSYLTVFALLHAVSGT